MTERLSQKEVKEERDEEGNEDRRKNKRERGRVGRGVGGKDERTKDGGKRVKKGRNKIKIKRKTGREGGEVEQSKDDRRKD